MRDDRELLAAWRAGDKAAGGELVDRHLAALGRFFANKVGSEHDAHDLVASTFEVVLHKLDEFRGDSSFRTYLFAIAHNVLRGHLRDRQRAEARFEHRSASVGDDGPSPSAMLVLRQEQRVVLAALRRLPLELQILLELTYFEALPRSEIATVLGIAAGTVASRLRRARALLAAAVAELAAEPALRRSTMSDLDGWARSLRAQLGRDPSS